MIVKDRCSYISRVFCLFQNYRFSRKSFYFEFIELQMLQSYILIKVEVYIVTDFIFIRKNYAFIRGLYLLLQFTIMFIMNEFMKFP